MNADLLELPRSRRLAGKMAERLAGRIGKSAAAADPGAVPTLSEQHASSGTRISEPIML
jgi:hypothetical protein